MRPRGWGATALMLGLALALPGACADAQPVALSGMLGNKALLMVGNGPPHSVAPGDSYEGVKVISTSGDQAVVEIGGRRQTLRVGDTPASFGGHDRNSGNGTITITAGSDGHFTTPGSIDGHAVQFIVDTGASMISMSVPQAERAGLNYRAGQPVRVNTANGATQGWRITLDSVRVGDVQVSGVDAVVTPQPMTYVLLGHSFLTRFRMQQNADVMTLQRRY
ncbi:MAG: TIGR02281 family clan AA aspartic protease [Burkholderiales bacterium]|nr:TIGR02281 family clan AA aspartic protease [Burkholderiales bacterium]